MALFVLRFCLEQQHTFITDILHTNLSLFTIPTLLSSHRTKAGSAYIQTNTIMSKRTSVAASGSAASSSNDATVSKSPARMFILPLPRYFLSFSVPNHHPVKLTPHPPTVKDNKQDLLLSSDVGHFSLVRALHLADLITELNGLCGILSVFSSLRYCVATGPLASALNTEAHSTLYWALGFLPLGLFFDFFDGKVARWRKKSSMMGQELDSLADLVCLPPIPQQATFLFY